MPFPFGLPSAVSVVAGASVAASSVLDAAKQRAERRSVLDELRAVRARDELNNLQRLRLVRRAAVTGASQRDIARELDVSQPEVHRMLKRIRLEPACIEESPREVILRQVVGELSRQDMMDLLIDWPYTYSDFPEPNDPESEAFSRGTFDQVMRAVGDGLLAPEDYARISETIDQRQGAQVARHETLTAR